MVLNVGGGGGVGYLHGNLYYNMDNDLCNTLVLLVRLELNGLVKNIPHNTPIDTHNHCLNSLSKLFWMDLSNSIVLLLLRRGPGHGSVIQTSCAAVVILPSAEHNYRRQLQVPRLDLRDITNVYILSLIT